MYIPPFHSAVVPLRYKNPNLSNRSNEQCNVNLTCKANLEEVGRGNITNSASVGSDDPYNHPRMNAHRHTQTHAHTRTHTHTHAHATSLPCPHTYTQHPCHAHTHIPYHAQNIYTPAMPTHTSPLPSSHTPPLNYAHHAQPLPYAHLHSTPLSCSHTHIPIMLVGLAHDRRSFQYCLPRKPLR